MLDLREVALAWKHQLLASLSCACLILLVRLATYPPRPAATPWPATVSPTPPLTAAIASGVAGTPFGVAPTAGSETISATTSVPALLTTPPATSDAPAPAGDRPGGWWDAFSSNLVATVIGGPIIAALVAFVTYRFVKRPKRDSYCFRALWLPSDRIKPAHLLGVGAMARPYYEYYHHRPQDDDLRRWLTEGKSILLTGRPWPARRGPFSRL